MFLKRFFVFLVLAIAGQSCFASISIEFSPIPEALMVERKPPVLDAKSWILVEPKSGWIIASKEMNNKIEPASLTKLMTIYIAFQQLQRGQLALDDRIRISKKAWQMEGSRMFVEVGDEISVLKILKGVIVQSGNDASVALAEHIAGSEAAYVSMMNETAKSLGLNNTHYTNVSGLPDPDHYSTSLDIAKLSAQMIDEFPDYYVWFSLKKFKHNKIEQINRNKLLFRNIGVDGLKTGHTESAGYCLAATSQRKGLRFITVVAGAKSELARAEQASVLLEYGHVNFEAATIVNEDKQNTLRVYGGDQESVGVNFAKKVNLIKPKRVKGEFAYHYELPRGLTAPLEKNQTISVAELMFNNTSILDQPLVIDASIKKGGLYKRAIDRVKQVFDNF